MERVYNALRLGHALAKKDPTAEMTVFPMADAVLAAKGGQKSPRVSTTSNASSSECSPPGAAFCCGAPAWMHGG
jgi:sulfur relay (sulfurtransferase) complex TusBCD TusD component (DsrE family)